MVTLMITILIQQCRPVNDNNNENENDYHAKVSSRHDKGGGGQSRGGAILGQNSHLVDIFIF